MESNEIRAKALLASLLEVEPQIYTKSHLDNQHEHQRVCEPSVDIRRKLAAFVAVAHEVCDDSNNASDNLEGNVPARADYLYDADLNPSEKKPPHN